jgi:Leucine-rich repeat (LRR) protein
MSSDQRQLLARLKKLLLSRDVDLIVQGVEFVASLGEQEVWDALLHGVGYATDRVVELRSGTWKGPSLVPNPLFSGTSPAQVYHDLAMTLLVANSPLEELKAQVVSLRLRASAGGWRDPRISRMPLEGLEQFPNLKHLSIETPAAMDDISVLGRCPALESLRLDGGARLSDLAGLGASRTLRQLEIYAPLESTRGIEGAPLDSVKISSRVLQDLMGLGQTPVRTVEIRDAARVDPSALRACPKLEQLSFSSCAEVVLAGLGGCPVQTLEITGPTSGTLPSLTQLRTLQVTHLTHMDRQPALSKLTLYALNEPGHALPKVRELCPALETLILKRCTGSSLELVRDAASLRTLILEDCIFSDTSALGSLTTLDALGLQRLRADALDSLPPAQNVDANGQPTEQLYLAYTPLRSVRGVGNLQGVLVLDLSQCAELQTLDGLQGSQIRVLDLRGCAALEDVSALEEMPELRMVGLRGTRFHARNVPESASGAVSLGKTLNQRAGLTMDRPQPASGAPKRKSVPVPKDQREAWEDLQPLLAVVDREGVDRLADWLAQHGTEEMFDALLKAVAATDRAFTVRGRLLEPDRDLRELVVQRVVGVAKGAEARRLAAARTHWSTSGVMRTSQGRVAGPVDLRGLERFQEVVNLTVQVPERFLAIEVLSQLPKLAHLTVSGAAPLDAAGPMPELVELVASQNQTTRLDFVRHAPKLRELRMASAALVDIGGLTGHPTLTYVMFSDLSRVTDLSPLRSLPQANHLLLGICPTLPSLRELSKLDHLSLTPRGWGDLTCLAELPARELDLSLAGAIRLHGLDRLPRLEHLSIWAQGPLDLRYLPRKLRQLTLHGHPVDLQTLPAMELDTLVLSNLADLSFVSKLAGLRKLELNPSYGSQIPDLAPLREVATLEELHLQPSMPTSVAPLRGHPALKRIAVSGWRRSHLEVPEDMAHLVT